MQTKQSPRHCGGNHSAGFNFTDEEMMAHKENGFNHKEVMGYDLPGIGAKGEIEDCSIGVQGDPGCVTVTFSTVNGETLLILDPSWAEILSEQLYAMADQARKPDTALTLVKG